MTSRELYIVKIGGAVIDDAVALSAFLQSFAAIKSPKLLVHGGGRRATELATQMGIPQQMHQGRRITDAVTLEIATMVYGGSINKQIVAALQASGCNALGLCGADGDLLKSVRRPVKDGIDFGYVGDVLPGTDTALLQLLLDNGYTPVVAPLTHDGQGQLLNTNADTMAQELAKALAPLYSVKLVYTFEKNGVLLDTTDDASVIPLLEPGYYGELKAAGTIYAGMIPKLDNAFAAVAAGVKQVVIGSAAQLEQIVAGHSGTIIQS